MNTYIIAYDKREFYKIVLYTEKIKRVILLHCHTVFLFKFKVFPVNTHRIKQDCHSVKERKIPKKKIIILNCLLAYGIKSY